MLIFPLWINVRSLNAYIIHILFIHAIYYFKEKSHLKHSILPHTTYVGYSVERKCNVFVERICNIKDEAYCLKSCVIFFLSIMIQFVIGSKCGSMQDVIYVKTYASSEYSFSITLSRQDISQSNHPPQMTCILISYFKLFLRLTKQYVYQFVECFMNLEFNCDLNLIYKLHRYL